MQTQSAKAGQAALKAALVVDTSDDASTLLQKVLDSAGWQVTSVPDNLAALECVQARPFDVIVTNEDSPGEDDVELLRKVRSIRPHARVIILTNQSTDADVITAIREHAFSYFARPFSSEELAAVVQSAMDAPAWDDGIEVLSANPTWIHLFARCDIQTADRLLRFLQEIGDDLPHEEAKAVGIAFREMLLNAIEHGGRFDPSEYVEISYLRTRRTVSCRIRDPGKGFSLDDITHAAIANPPDDPLQHLTHRDAQGLRSGGYGVLLARELVDELIYSETGNEVVLVKYIDPSSTSSSGAAKT